MILAYLINISPHFLQVIFHTVALKLEKEMEGNKLVCHRKVLKKNLKKSGKSTFHCCNDRNISISSSLRLWSITVFPYKSGTPCSEVSTLPLDHYVKQEPLPPHGKITLLFSLTVLNKENLILLPSNLKPFKLQLKPNQYSL